MQKDSIAQNIIELFIKKIYANKIELIDRIRDNKSPKAWEKECDAVYLFHLSQQKGYPFKHSYIEFLQGVDFYLADAKTKLVNCLYEFDVRIGYTLAIGIKKAKGNR